MKDTKGLIEKIVNTNPEAFVDGDPNQLKAGAEITLPLGEEQLVVNAPEELSDELENVETNELQTNEQNIEPQVEEKEEEKQEESPEDETAESVDVSAEQATQELESQTQTQAPQVQEGVSSDVVNTVEESQETVDVAIEEPGFFARNWMWLGALAGGGIAYAASQDDDEPIPVPTLSVSDSEVASNESSFTVSGTADKNATVAVTAGGLTKNVTSDAEGAYTATFTEADIAQVGQGNISVSVTSNRNGGRVSETSTASLQIDTINPDAPLINSVTADNVISASEVSSIITGDAEANSTLVLTISGDAKTIVVAENGTWSYTLTTSDIIAMGEGAETLTLSTTDSFGNVSETTSFVLSVDTVVPTAPTMADATADNVINSAEQTSTLSGTAEAGSSVSLSLGGLTKSLTADANGAWTYELTSADVTAMGEGAEDITITATDAAGNTSTTTTKAIAVDTVAPSAPTMADATADNVINSAEQTSTLSGTAEAGSSVSLSLGGLTKSLTADANGAWTYELTAADVTAMGEGAEDITITATDAAGNTSTTTTKAIAVDTVAPSAPTMADATADNVINSAEQTSTLSGTAEADSSVSLSLGGLTKSLTADANGAWTYELTSADVTAMGEGAEDITITATDAAGNTSTTTTKAIAVDTVAPSAPTMADATADNVINSAEQTSTLSGTAEAGSSVSLSLGGLTKSLTADANGAWTYDLTAADVTAMGEGAEDITITATDAAGNTSTTTTKAIAVDTVAPSAPTMADATADNVINSAEQTSTLSGTAEAGSSVSLTLGGLTKSLTADANGAWTYELTAADVTAMGEGAEDITITATDAAGNTSTTTTKAIAVDTVAPTAPTMADATADNVINSAEQTSTLSGTAEAGSSVSLSLGGLTKSLTADANGAWTYELTAADVTAMGEGAEDITITATDAAGNTSTTTTKAIAVDTVAPTAPTMADATADNVINIAEQTSTLSGTAEAGSSVSLTLGGLTKSLTADANGAWTYELTAADVTAMGEGAEDITITATDAAGNTSTTTTKAIAVDTVAPTIVSIEADAANQQITLSYSAALDNANTIDVTAFNVVISNNANAVASATVSGNEVVLIMTDAFVAGSAVVVGYTDATGDQTTAIQDSAGNDVDTFNSGVVADGYIRGAQIYLDANANGVADAEELLTDVVTDALGNFVLSAADNPNGYAIIATGGINIDTGLPNNTALKAPAGSSVINPITTLIQTVVENNVGTSLADAKASVNKALGVSADLDLTTFDPISSLNSGDTNATQALGVQKAATQIVALIQLATQDKSAEQAGTDSQNIVNNLVEKIVATDSAIDFADTAVITAAVSNVAVAVAIVDIVTVAQTLKNATSIEEVSQAQAEALDDIAPDAVESVTFAALTKDNTPNVTVTFDAVDGTGKAAVAGDVLTVEAIQGDNTVTTEVVLSAADIAKGSVTAPLEALSDATYTVTTFITDRAGNSSAVITESATLTVDTTSPTVSVTIDDTVVNASETATVTLTFTEDPLDTIVIGDLVATGGTLSDFAGTGTTRTVTFTPDADSEVAATVSVKAESYSDTIGNLGVTGSVELTVDTKAPTVIITSAESSLKAGESTLVTMTFSEVPNADIALGDFTVTGGTLSDLVLVDNIATASFTPTPDSEETATITLSANSFSDLAGNPVMTASALDIAVDTLGASITTKSFEVAENSTTVGTVVSNETATVTLGTGDDSALFTLTDGVLTLNEAQDFETDATELTVAFELEDSAGNTSTDTATVTITNVNEAPTAEAIADQTAVVNQTFSLDTTTAFSDVDANDTLTYTLAGDLPTGLTFVDGVISGTATADTAATDIQVTATDAGGLSVTQTLSVRAVSAPVISSIDVKQGEADLARSGETLTVTATLSEAFALTLNDASPTLTLTLGEQDIVATYASHDGTAKTVTFTATAPVGDATSVVVKSIALGAANLVGDVSAQPLAVASTGQTDSNFVLDNTSAALSVDSFDTAENSTTVGTIVSNETATVTLGTGEDSALFTLTDGVLTLKEAQDFETDATELTVAFELEDSAGNTSTDTATVTITNVNEAPTADSIADQTAVVGEAFSVNVATAFSDVDANDTLTYTLAGDLPTGLTFVDGVISGTATADTAATDIQVTATDAGGLSVTQTLSVRAVSAPVISSIDVKQGEADLARSGETLTVTATLSEAFALTLNDASPTLTLTLGGQDIVATYASHEGTAKTVTFTATAPVGDATSVVVKSIALGAASLVGDVSAQPLAVASTGQTDSNFVLDNTSAALSVDSFDTAENSITVGTIVSSETATVTLGTGDDSALFTLTDGVLTLKEAQDFETDATELTVAFDLEDSAGNTSTDTATVTITNVNEAPTAETIADQTAVVNQTFSLDTTTAFSDVDANDTLTYTIEGELPAGITFLDGILSGNSSAEIRFSELTVTATDKEGLSVSTTFNLSALDDPIITTNLSELGNKMLDVRSDIVLQVNQSVSAVPGKKITFIDNQAEGYQGETNKVSFTIDVTSDLVTIDNDKGLIIINVDENFDLDLSSEYTMSIDDGAFMNIETGLSSSAFANVTFETITPTSGKDNISGLGQIDEVASQANYFENKWLVDWLADTAENNWFNTTSGLPVSLTLTNKQAYDLLLDGQTLLTSNFKPFNLAYLRDLSDSFHESAEDSIIEAYDIVTEAAQSYMMLANDGSIVESSQWVDIEGLGQGLGTTGNAGSLNADIANNSVFRIDASSTDYVFVFSDQDTAGANDITGYAGVITNTDFAVFIDEFGAGDKIYVDDQNKDDTQLNNLSNEFFISGNGSQGSELFVGFSGANGDPRLYVGLEGDLVSTDDKGNADSTLQGVNNTLGLDFNDSLAITDGTNISRAAPVISTALTDMGDKMLDVRSDIVLQIDQAISAIAGKYIRFTDNQVAGYQGETSQNSFEIEVTSELVTIDNEKGLVIINVDETFDFDLSSQYTMSIEQAAFVSNASGLMTAGVEDIVFNTVTPLAGGSNVSQLSEISDTDSLSYIMSSTDGSLQESAQWVDIEGLGDGTNSGLNALSIDVADGNVFRIDASSDDYVFVFSDQNPAGGNAELASSGIRTNTGFSVFLDNFGADDQIYIDDAFNDIDKQNILDFEIFASGDGSSGAELFVGLVGNTGDPRLYVGFEDDLSSTDDNGNADSTLDSVNNTLGLDLDDSAVITA